MYIRFGTVIARGVDPTGKIEGPQCVDKPINPVHGGLSLIELPNWREILGVEPTRGTAIYIPDRAIIITGKSEVRKIAKESKTRFVGAAHSPRILMTSVYNAGTGGHAIWYLAVDGSKMIAADIGLEVRTNSAVIMRGALGRFGNEAIAALITDMAAQLFAEVKIVEDKIINRPLGSLLKNVKIDSDKQQQAPPTG
jgi:hypothetical protein